MEGGSDGGRRKEVREEGKDELEAFREEIRRKYGTREVGEGADPAVNYRKDAAEAPGPRLRGHPERQGQVGWLPEREQTAFRASETPESSAAQEEISDEPAEFGQRQIESWPVAQEATRREAASERDEDLWKPPEGDECDPKAADSRKAPTESEAGSDSVARGANEGVQSILKVKNIPEKASNRPARVHDSGPDDVGRDFRQQENTKNAELVVGENRGSERDEREVHDSYIATFVATARQVPRSEGSTIRFDIERSALERELGYSFEYDETYEIKGSIEDSTQFVVIHSRNEGRRLYITAPPESKDEFEPGRSYELKIISVEKKRTYRGFEPEPGQLWLQLQKNALTSIGIDMESLEGKDSQERIGEITLRNLSHEGEAPKVFYAQVDSENGITLRLGRFGVTKDNELELVAGRIYNVHDCVKDINAHKGENFEDTSLRMDGNKLTAEVNGESFEFSEFKLDSHGMRVFLKARVEQSGHDIRFIYDANEGKVTVKTGEGNLVRGFDASDGHQLRVRYGPSRHATAEVEERAFRKPDKMGTPHEQSTAPIIPEPHIAESVDDRASLAHSERHAKPREVSGTQAKDLESATIPDKPGEGLRKLEPPEGYIAGFRATAQHRTKDGRTAFELDVKSVEEQSGVCFQEGKTYAISGDIEGLSEFRKMYSTGSGEKMVVFAPQDLADSVDYGSKYNVRIENIEEVSRSREHLGAFYEAPYRVEGSSDRVKFDILLETFQQRTGIRFEERTTYEIRGTIDNITDFSLTHSRSEGKYLYITPPREAAAKIEPGRKYEIKVLAVDEKRVYTPHEPKPGEIRLQLQNSALKSVGIDLRSLKGKDPQDRIVEFTMRNLSHKGELAKKLYSRVNPTEGAILNLASMGTKKSHSMELIGARPFRPQDFVIEFNAHRGSGLQNMALHLEGDRMELRVDGRGFLLENYRLDTNALRAFLKTQVSGYKREFYFVYDPVKEETTAKYAGSKEIKAIELSPTGALKFRYGEIEETQLAASEMTTPNLHQSKLEFSKAIQLLEDTKKIDGNHKFEETEELDSYIGKQLENLKVASKEYRIQKGSIGEDIAAAVITKLGLVEVERHPFDENGPGKEYYRHGSDILFKNDTSNEFFLFEPKWWGNTDAASKKAVQDMLSRQPDEREHRKWGKIAGAYIAIVSLDSGNRVGEVQLKRVW